MRFIRAINREGISKSVLDNLDQFGFTLVYRADIIEVWGLQ